MLVIAQRRINGERTILWRSVARLKNMADLDEVYNGKFRRAF